MNFDHSSLLFLFNSASNFIGSQILLANPDGLLRFMNVRNGAIAVGLARYRGTMQVAFTLMSIQGMVSSNRREKRVTALSLALTSAAQCCMDWAMVWSGIYLALPVAIVDGILSAINIGYYLSE